MPNELVSVRARRTNFLQQSTTFTGFIISKNLTSNLVLSVSKYSESVCEETDTSFSSFLSSSLRIRKTWYIYILKNKNREHLTEEFSVCMSQQVQSCSYMVTMSPSFFTGFIQWLRIFLSIVPPHPILLNMNKIKPLKVKPSNIYWEVLTPFFLRPAMYNFLKRYSIKMPN